ncbi:MAG: hypothetical protein HN576_10480 [Bacteriovoracaceae bacterium]|jgi:flagellin-like hook-associated protein FlgL|nr:hypothetical protein [Bacteriovoracaceae bacterium]
MNSLESSSNFTGGKIQSESNSHSRIVDADYAAIASKSASAKIVESANIGTLKRQITIPPKLNQLLDS